MSYTSGPWEVTQVLPDARLIAAAPELLAACEAAYAYLGAHGWAYGGSEQWDIMDGLKAALAHVRGEEIE